jgi:hypothetical protein
VTDQIDLEELIDAKKRNMTTPKKRERTAHGHLDSNDAARQSSILANLRAGLESGIVEQRLSIIEDQILRLASSHGRAPLLNSFTVKPDEPEPKAPSED